MEVNKVNNCRIPTTSADQSIQGNKYVLQKHIDWSLEIEREREREGRKIKANIIASTYLHSQIVKMSTFNTAHPKRKWRILVVVPAAAVDDDDNDNDE